MTATERVMVSLLTALALVGFAGIIFGNTAEKVVGAWFAFSFGVGAGWLLIIAAHDATVRRNSQNQA